MRYINIVIAIIVAIIFTSFVGNKVLIGALTKSGDTYSEIECDFAFNQKYYRIFSFKVATEYLTLTHAALKIALILALFSISLTAYFLLFRLVRSLRSRRTNTDPRVSLPP